MDEHVRQLLHDLFNAVRVPLFLVDDAGLVLSLPGEGEEVLTSSTVNLFVERARGRGAPFNQPVIFELPPAHFIGVVAFADGSHLVVGPAVPLRHPEEYVRETLADSPYLSCGSALVDWFLSCPLCTAPQFFSILRMAVFIVSGELPPDEIRLSKDETDSHNEAVQKRHLRETVIAQEERVFHFSQEYEDGLMDAVEHGDFELLKQRSLSIRAGSIGPLSDDALRREKYVFVEVATLFSRAAVRGGLDFEMASNLFDSYCHQVDTLDTIKGVEQLQVQMSKDFCEQVRENRCGGELSQSSRACMEHISKNLHQRITLDDLAAICGMSPRRLSQKFYRETGVRITDYINRVKLSEAARLLRYTNESLSAISSLLCYSSQSYFTTLFKRRYGLTPLQYRNAGWAGSSGPQPKSGSGAERSDRLATPPRRGR